MCCVLIDIHVLLFPSFFLFTLSARVFSYSCSFSFYHLFSARCSWPSSNQSPNDATTHLLFTLIRSILLSHFFLLSYIQLSLSLSRLSLLIVYFLSLSRRTHDAQIFYMCVCSLFSSFLLCVSSFIDYLNVTTKLDISTSSNKLGFCFFLMCVFPFILNISLLFFKRLKLRIFYPSFDRALLFPSSSLRCFF